MAKKNYRPVSILNSLSKLFENLYRNNWTLFYKNLCGNYVAIEKEYPLNILFWFDRQLEEILW